MVGKSNIFVFHPRDSNESSGFHMRPLPLSTVEYDHGTIDTSRGRGFDSKVHESSDAIHLLVLVMSKLDTVVMILVETFN